MADSWEPVKPHEAVRTPKPTRKGRTLRAPTTNSKFTSTSTRTRQKIGAGDVTPPSVDKFVSNVMAKAKTSVSHLKEVKIYCYEMYAHSLRYSECPKTEHPNYAKIQTKKKPIPRHF